jgi:hypothetical protein
MRRIGWLFLWRGDPAPRTVAEKILDLNATKSILVTTAVNSDQIASDIGILQLVGVELRDI